MENNLWMKVFGIGVIILFLGASVVPNISGNRVTINTTDNTSLPPPGYKFALVGFKGKASNASYEQVGFFRLNLELNITDGFMMFYFRGEHAEPADHVSLVNFIGHITYGYSPDIVLLMIGFCWYKIT